MRHKLFLVCTVFVLIFYADVLGAKSSRRRTGGSWGSRGSWGSSSKYTTPRSSYPQPSSQHQSHASGGSSPDKIGWNVADKKPAGSNTPVRASAPVNEQASKTSASNVQSSYNPSGGYPRQPASNPYNPAGQAYPGQGGYSAPVGHGGYNAPVGHGGYNAPVGQGGYNAPVGHGYNAPVGHGYNGPVGTGYNGPVGTGYNGPVGTGYNPGMGHSPYGGQPGYGGHSPYGGQPSYGGPVGGFGQPSYGSAFGSAAPSPQQTILLQQSSKPGIGQLAKEAFVFAGVSAGVNAAVNRIIPGGIYGTSGSSGGSHGGGAPGQPVSHTQITYNNYYNNGTAPVEGAAPGAAPAAPAGQPAPQPSAQPPADAPQTQQNNPGTNNSPPASSNSPDSTQNNPNPLGFVTSNDDLKRLTESLYQKEKDNNAFSQITMKLQGQKKDDSTTDDASEPLLDVKAEAYDLPTVKAVLALHDNYELDVKTKETVTSEERREESDLLDKIAETDIIKSTMKFLADKGYIPDDEYEFKDSMKRIWFSQFKRIDGDASSSGFETVFLAEKFDNDILGLHNWIYYAKQEAAGKLNYLGYLKEAKLGDKGAILKLRSSLDGIVQPVSTVFVGTSPELEFALYTMCFFTRPNNPCPVSLGGTEFTIFVSRINYFGKDILISAYPDV